MGGGSRPKYGRQRQFTLEMRAKDRLINEQNINIKSGKGRYPKCLDILPYSWCPKKEEIPNNPIELHKNCKSCEEFSKSNFSYVNFHADRLKSIRERGLPTRVEF